ncbi:MAG: ABC transporter ATP-binding protein [Alicyclobacillus herbarius]|uniref:ABC transporter ATP-binding protein n=1 Tax=Alicyclobacillus herbarius TaxID=122960 RepID=UPI002352A5A2|nr:ABC transporter ATP-binding protein [Alicyclobacillus herbarius]MCL6632438.1 ABC transporter ATP-binding protein [Alicyclobacillus herbarius]
MSRNDLLVVENLNKTFKVPGGTLRAVQNASFRLEAGKTLGLVGESGSGKSTLGRTVLRLIEADSGSIQFDGVDIRSLSAKELRLKRKDMQMIFQNPLSSLNPRMTVERNIKDPLIIHDIGDAKERSRRVRELMERVGLSDNMAHAYPTELSGGQQQRVAIARALALNPKLIVCDEAVSALDVSIQLQIISLLQDLQRENHLSYIFISHNLAVVEYMSDYVAVMYLGEIVEQAPVDELFANPQHPYTRVLMQSVLKVPASLEQRSTFKTLPGEIPSPIHPPSGCPFHPRCPLASDECRSVKPEVRPVNEQHQVACHKAELVAQVV